MLDYMVLQVVVEFNETDVQLTRGRRYVCLNHFFTPPSLPLSLPLLSRTSSFWTYMFIFGFSRSLWREESRHARPWQGRQALEDSTADNSQGTARPPNPHLTLGRVLVSLELDLLCGFPCTNEPCILKGFNLKRAVPRTEHKRRDLRTPGREGTKTVSSYGRFHPSFFSFSCLGKRMFP